MDTWVASMSWLLWIMYLWTWVNKYWFETLFSIILGIYPGVGLLGHTVVLFLIFWESSFYIPTNSVQGFHFSTFLPTFIIFCCFDSSHPNTYEVVFHCSFDLHFPNDYWCWASLHVLIGNLYVFFGEMSVKVFAIFEPGCLFSGCWILGVLHIFWVIIPYQIYNCMYLLSPIIFNDKIFNSCQISNTNTEPLPCAWSC